MELTVGDLTRMIKETLSDDCYKGLWIRGEVSNSSGSRYRHLYFTLKDTEAQLKCIMFNHSRALSFDLDDGMKVLAYGDIGVYESNGVYQLYVQEIKTDGVGELYKAYEQLKARLEAEGLFDPVRKREIPRYPQRIGVATSAHGAALQDMLNVLGRRYPCEVVLAPTAVQGDGAAEEIAWAINRLNEAGVDVIIAGRGGGSLEDLWAFNEEVVARAIYASTVPVISAVGHETDFCIADFVADLRAPTPSAAAELVAASREEAMRSVLLIEDRMTQVITGKIGDHKERLEHSKRVLDAGRFHEELGDHICRVNELCGRIKRELELRIDRSWDDLESKMRRLDAAGPIGTLKRGYGMSFVDGEIVDSVERVDVGDSIEVVLFDGSIDCQVTGKEEEVGGWNLKEQWQSWRRSCESLKRKS